MRTQTVTSIDSFLNPANFSVVLLARFDLNMEIVRTKIMDFKNLSSDAGLYVDTPGGTMTFLDDGGFPEGTGGTNIIPDYVQIVLTREDSSNTVNVYLNGTLAFTFEDTLGLAVMGDSSITGNAFLTLFKDDTAVDTGGFEGTQGHIARLRLYDRRPLSRTGPSPRHRHSRTSNLVLARRRRWCARTSDPPPPLSAVAAGASPANPPWREELAAWRRHFPRGLCFHPKRSGQGRANRAVLGIRAARDDLLSPATGWN